MKHGQTIQQPFTYATVPLQRDYLRQSAMLDPRDADKSYPLPLVTPGQEALIIDAERECTPYNTCDTHLPLSHIRHARTIFSIVLVGRSVVSYALF